MNTANERKTVNEQVMPMGELFALTWMQYKQRALPILIVILIGTILVTSLFLALFFFGVIGGIILTHLLSELTGFIIISAVISLLLLFIAIVFIWCQTAMLAIVVDEKLGIIQAFQRGRQYFWPMTWVLTFLSGILMTGFSFGILPGFLFLIWFSFCVFILLEEDKRGLDTLLVSREYVRDYGWDTSGKILAVWLISVVVFIIPFLGMVLSMLFTPFLMMYLLNIYHDLKSIKGPVEPAAGTGGRIFWWSVTLIGLILPIAGLLAVLYFLLAGDSQWMIQSWQGMHQTSI